MSWYTVQISKAVDYKLKSSVPNSEKFANYDTHLKKAGGYNKQNVVNIIIRDEDTNLTISVNTYVFLVNLMQE